MSSSTNYSIEPLQYNLAPGYVITNPEPTVVALELGSGVAVCLYDHVLGLGGVSHFREPRPRGGRAKSVAYGSVAIPALIKLMCRLGASPISMEAQVFGGGHRCRYASDLGRQNLKAALRALKRAGIKITSQDVGGSKSRRLLFHTGTNDVLCLKTGSSSLENWHPHYRLH